MDLKATLYLTPKGMLEAGNRRSTLDFKSRSILTSLKNREKTLTDLLDKIFIENKEAISLVNSLGKIGHVTTDINLSAKSLGSAKGEPQALAPQSASAQVPSKSVSAEATPSLVNPESDVSRRRQNELIARVRREKAEAEREAAAKRAEVDRLEEIAAQRIAAEAAASKAEVAAQVAAEQAKRVSEELREREIKFAAEERAKSEAEAVLRMAQEKEEAIRAEHQRIEAERAAFENSRKEAEHQEGLRAEAERLEVERLKFQREESEREELARKEAQRQEVLRQESERKELARQEAERQEVMRQESEREELARQEAERQEVERKEYERRENEATKARDEQHKHDVAVLAAEEELERRRADGARIAAEIQAQMDKDSAKTLNPERLSVSEVGLTSQEYKYRSEIVDSSSEPASAKPEVPSSRFPVSPASNGDNAASEPLVPALTDDDTIDIIHVAEEVASPSPTMGRSLRPVLARFLPGNRSKEEQLPADSEQTRVIPATQSASTHKGETLEIISPSLSTKPKIDLKPVVSKVRRENGTRRIPSLIKPAIDTSKKPPSAGLLGNPGGARGDFLSSFSRETTTTVPGTKSTGLKVGRGKPDLTPVSASATKALTLSTKIIVSEGIFLLSDFCIDHMSTSAADLIDRIERCRDRVSLQATIKEIHSLIGLNEKGKLEALIKKVEEINATA